MASNFPLDRFSVHDTYPSMSESAPEHDTPLISIPIEDAKLFAFRVAEFSRSEVVTQPAPKDDRTIVSKIPIIARAIISSTTENPFFMT